MTFRVLRGMKSCDYRVSSPGIYTSSKHYKTSEEEKKVIYEPVKLEQNYRNFDYESPWEGTKYIKEQTKK